MGYAQGGSGGAKTVADGGQVTAVAGQQRQRRTVGGCRRCEGGGTAVFGARLWKGGEGFSLPCLGEKFIRTFFKKCDLSSIDFSRKIAYNIERAEV